MSRRVVILGNSHVAALREAWRGAPGRWPGIEAIFVGARGDLMVQTRMEGGRLVPEGRAATEAFARCDHPGGVDLARADDIVIAGCAVALSQTAVLWREARWPGLPSLDRAADIAAVPQTMLSRPAARAAAAGRLRDRLGLRLLREIRPAVPGRVRVVSQPRMSALARRRPIAAAGLIREAAAAGDGPALAALHDEAATAAVEAEGGLYQPQPARTVEAALFTAEAFMAGAVRLTPSGRDLQPPTDVTHANAAYGTAVLDELFAAIGD